MIVCGEAVGKWVVEKSGGAWTHVCRAIGQVYDGKLIAGVMYDGYTGSNIAMSSRIDDPRHVSREWIWAMLDYPFNKLQVKRVSAITNVNNLKAQKVNERLGFRREAVLGDYFPDGDAILYVMRREDCDRFLRSRNGIRCKDQV